MHFLVTGATGFIGKRVVRQLLARGHTVTALVRSNYDGHLAENIHYIEFDIDCGDPETLYFSEKIDCVIHLAWGNLLNYNDPAHSRVFPQSHYHFLTHLARLGIHRFTIAGTSLEYGLKEGSLREDMTCDPVTEYGRGKLALLNLFSPFCRDHDCLLQWCRVFYLYAEDQRPQSFLGQLGTAYNAGADEFAMSPGDQLRDYLHADAVADAFIRIAQQTAVNGIINIGSGHGTSVASLAEKFLRERNSGMRLNRGRYPYPPYEPFAFWADTTKLRKIHE